MWKYICVFIWCGVIIWFEVTALQAKNEYTHTSTLVCGYIMSHYALKCHQKIIGQEQLH